MREAADRGVPKRHGHGRAVGVGAAGRLLTRPSVAGRTVPFRHGVGRPRPCAPDPSGAPPSRFGEVTMRSVPVVALVLVGAAVAAAQVTMPALHGPTVHWALFSFAVSAFREPLR